MTTQITSSTSENGITTVTVEPKVSAGGIIAGLLFFLLGGVVIAVDSIIALGNKEQLHTAHLLIGVVLCALGIIVALGAFVLPRFKQLGVVVQPYLQYIPYIPKFGGGRPGDPQPNGTINPPNPPQGPPPPGAPL
jgi:hypothetical protein